MRYLQSLLTEKGIKPDLKDKKILYLLSQNARMSATAIAKKVGLSRDAVSYRVGGMVKQGIIQGYRTVIDMELLGYSAYHLFLQLNQPLPEIEENLIKKFKAYPFIRAILKFSGKYDFELALIAKDIQEFDCFLNKILDDCATFVQDYEVLIITKNYQSTTFPKSFLTMENTIKKEGIVPMVPDTKDKKILYALANDASLPFYRVAETVGLSADAIPYRINKMLKAGIISRFIPVINYALFPYNIYAIIVGINGFKEEKEIILKKFLRQDPNIIWCVKTVGKYNLLFYVCVNHTEDLHKTLIHLRGLFPGDIKNYETLIAYEEYKYTYFPEIALD